MQNKTTIKTEKRFHIITKSEVARAFSMSPTEIIEMKKFKISDDKRAFDGICFENRVVVRMLGNKKSKIYDDINSVVSIPIDKNIISSLKNSGGNCLRNSIIVNTPLETRAVVIDFPETLRSIISIPKSVLLHPLHINTEMRLAGSKAGIDVGEKVKNWNAFVSIKFPDWVFSKMGFFIDELKKCPVSVNCYFLSRDETFDIGLGK